MERHAPQEPGSKISPGTSAFYQRIISNNSYTHDEQGNTPWQEKGFDGVLYSLWPLLIPWVAASRLLAALAWLKLKGVAGHSLVQHTAPVRAKPDSRPRLEEARYKYPTSCSLPTYPSFTLHIMHTLAHTYQFPSSPSTSTLDHNEVSVLRSRAGWTSAHNNEHPSNNLHSMLQTTSCLWEKTHFAESPGLYRQCFQSSRKSPYDDKLTEHFLSLLPKPGTVYLQNSRLLPVQETLSNIVWRPGFSKGSMTHIQTTIITIILSMFY